MSYSNEPRYGRTTGDYGRTRGERTRYWRIPVSLPLTETLLPFSLNQISRSAQLKTTKENFEKDMEHLGRVLDDLDELGEIISEMLQTQETIQVRLILCISNDIPLLTSWIGTSGRRPHGPPPPPNDPRAPARTIRRVPNGVQQTPAWNRAEAAV